MPYSFIYIYHTVFRVTWFVWFWTFPPLNILRFYKTCHLVNLLWEADVWLTKTASLVFVHVYHELSLFLLRLCQKEYHFLFAVHSEKSLYFSIFVFLLPQIGLTLTLTLTITLTLTLTLFVYWTFYQYKFISYPYSHCCRWMLIHILGTHEPKTN